MRKILDSIRNGKPLRDNHEVSNYEYLGTHTRNSPIKIGIVDGTRCNRSFLMGTALASWFAQRYYLNFGEAKVALVQLYPEEGVEKKAYRTYGMGNRLNGEKFVDIWARYALDFPFAVDDKVENFWAGVNWIIPGIDSELLGYPKEDRFVEFLVDRRYGEVSVYDMGYAGRKISDMQKMDVVIALAEPSLIRIGMSNHCLNEIEEYRQGGGDLIWVVVECNSGIEKGKVRRALNSGNVQWLDELESQRISRCEFSGDFAWEDGVNRGILWEFFDKISRYIE